LQAARSREPLGLTRIQPTIHLGWVVFAIAHIPLALVMQRAWPISATHALVTFAVGMWWAATDAPLERVAFVGAYISGAEVLWRMTEAYQLVYWEFGKYSLIAIFATAMLRTRSGKLPVVPLLYFAFLLPSITQSIARLDIGTAREQISFNLSGPASILMSAWFFTNLRLSPVQVKRLLFFLIVPVVGVGSIVANVLLSNTILNWILESNAVVTGGFGPNQVSGVLGLGWLVIWVALLFFELKIGYRIFLIVGSSWLMAASLLSFSRGGAINAIVPLLFVIGLSLTKPQFRKAAIVQFAIGIAIAILILIPQIETITSGTFSQRFADTSSTGRYLFVESDWETFLANPFWGVGPGVSKTARAVAFDRDLTTLAAHTEYTRLLAEHGILGAASVFLLGLMVWQNVKHGKTTHERAIIVSMVGWSLLVMANNAMRIVAVSYLFGLAFAIHSILDRPSALAISATQNRVGALQYSAESADVLAQKSDSAG